MKIPYFDAHCDTIGMGLHSGCSLRRNTCHVDLERGCALGAMPSYLPCLAR